MSKYLYIISILLVLIFASIAFTFFVIFPHTEDSVGARQDVTVTFSKDHKSFEPNVITVTEGNTVYLKFVNEDVQEHGITIDAFGVMSRALPGSTISLQPFVAKKAGHYIFYCPVLGEGSLNETGTLIVVPATQ